MGIQDRDYYKKWWNERDACQEKSAFRSPASSTDGDDGGDYLRHVTVKKKHQPWHPVLIALVTFFLCVGVYLLLKLIAKIAA